MRPQLSLRVAGVAVALGALASTINLAAAGTSPAQAQSITTTQSAATPAPAPVTTLGVGRTRLNVVAGRRALVTGVARPAQPVRTVELQRRTSRGWRTIDRVRTRARGSFTFRFRPRQVGSASLRVRAAGKRRVVGRLNVYRVASVSWYGPGLYGNSLGCGGRLTPGTVGVAHKSLPCGTRVTLRHRRRTIRVRVIDRGPYVGGREYDLTAATSRRLGFGGVGRILVTR